MTNTIDKPEKVKTPAERARSYATWCGLGIALIAQNLVMVWMGTFDQPFDWNRPESINPILTSLIVMATAQAVLRFVFGWMVDVVEEMRKR